MRTHRAGAVAGLAAAGLVAAVLTACSGSGTPPVGTPTTPTAATSSGVTPATGTPATETPATGTPATGTTAAPTGQQALVPLWPFTTAAAAASWQAAYRSTGAQAWHLDVDRTALSFATGHLGYREVDRVVTRSVAGGDARLGVGWADENGTAHVVAVVHLIRVGAERDAPWVVVGTDDTLLTLDRPTYGAAVSSPLTVSGRITGVDESLRVVVLGPASSTPLAAAAPLAAGGEHTPWSVTLRFTAAPGTVLTVAVSTGGHLKAVERFAITAVRAA